MEEDFYVTVFSNQSDDLYPQNSKSRFTAKLPKPLTFDKNKEYVVGLSEAYFSPVIGTTTSLDPELDVIQLPLQFKKEARSSDLDILIDLILNSAKEPRIYTIHYFRSFLNLRKLKSFETDPDINQHKTELDETKPRYFFKLFSFAAKYKDASNNEKFIELDADRKYSLKQIMWRVLDTFYKIFVEAAKNPNAIPDFNVDTYQGTVAENTFAVANIFVQTFLYHVMQRFDLRNHSSNYILLYTDIIRERMISNSLSKVLYVTNRNKNILTEEIYVKNLQYIPLAQTYIEEVSVAMYDEEGQLLVLDSEDGNPTCVQLHFKRIK